MRNGLRWSSGVGSSQRSRNVCAESPTAGPCTSSCMSCHGGRRRTARSRSTACGSPSWRASSCAAVAQVDAADERDVVVGPFGATDHDELLVVAAAPPHPLVEQDLAAGLVDLSDERGVLLLAEVRLSRVRSPQQPAHVHAAPREVGEHVADLGARAVEPLVGVALPVGEVDPVVPAEACRAPRSRRAKYSAPSTSTATWLPSVHAVAVAAPTVDLGGGVAALLRGQEPVVQPHDRSHYGFIVRR